MSLYLYVDHSNLWIEGQRVSAVARGVVPDIPSAIATHTFDSGWRLNFDRLYEELAQMFSDFGDVVSARLWGSPPPGDAFWRRIERAGFEVQLYERSFGKEKMVDTAVASHMMRDAYTRVDRDKDLLLLLAGDKDYFPTIEILTTDGFKVAVVFWEHAAGLLRRGPHRFYSLNPLLKDISLDPIEE